MKSIWTGLSLVSVGLLALVSLRAHGQSFRLELLDNARIKIHADKSDLALEEGYSQFDCDARIEQNAKLEYLDYARKQRRIYTFPLTIIFPNVADRTCVWWLRPCTHQECYLPIRLQLDRDAGTLTKLSSVRQPNIGAWPTPSGLGEGTFGVWVDRLIRFLMHWTLALGLFLGMVAGINPCNLPLIPLVLHYSRSGRSVWEVTLGAFLTITGLLVAVVLSGRLLGQTQILPWLGPWVHLIFAVILFGFGIWAIRGSFDWFQQWMSAQAQELPKRRLGGFFWGIIFAFLSLPCVGPILAIYGALLFNVQRPPVVSILSFSLGFVSWFFLWAWLGKRLRTISQQMFKAVEVTIGVAFMVLGLWRGVVFVQSVAGDTVPYTSVTPELEQTIASWVQFSHVSEPPREAQTQLYFFSAPWCIECQPYQVPLMRWQRRGAPIYFINIDELSETTLSHLRALGILGIPMFIWVSDSTLFLQGAMSLEDLEYRVRLGGWIRAP